MTHKKFSQRHGYRAQEHDIRIREEAPDELRQAILVIAEGEVGLRPSLIRDVLCAVSRRLPDPNNWSDYPNIWEECQYLISQIPWYAVYDFVEALYRQLARSIDPRLPARWESLVNDCFVELGVGWRMVNGVLESRGPEAFQVIVDAARVSLEQSGALTASQEIHEALHDLSRRPQPDATGAVQHAMAALECVAREEAGDRRATLGEILKMHRGLVPRPLDEALSKMWGYASESGRHLREGQAPGRSEAELVVGVAAAVCEYLASKLHGAST